MRQVWSIFLMIVLSTLQCKKKSSETTVDTDTQAKETIKAVVLFQRGKCNIDNKQAKLGDIAKQGQKISTKEKSICDLQIIAPKSQVVFRIQENSEIVLAQKKNSDGFTFDIELKQGKTLFRVKDKSVKYSVRTTVTTAGIRGTQYEVSYNKAKLNSSLKVFEGEVTYRLRLDKIEKLPKDVLEANPVLQQALTYMKEKEVSLKAGETIEVADDKVDKVLKDLKLYDVLQESDSKVLQNKLKDLQLDTEKVEPILQSTKLDTKITDAKLKECEELVAVNAANLPQGTALEKEISERNKQVQEKFDKRIKEESAKSNTPPTTNKAARKKAIQAIEKKYGKSSQTVILKNGKSINGVLLESKSGYKIVTPNGTINVKEEDIKEITF
ncbi:MAG: FecR family protein [Spirochaetota bacterium]